MDEVSLSSALEVTCGRCDHHLPMIQDFVLKTKVKNTRVFYDWLLCNLNLYPTVGLGSISVCSPHYIYEVAVNIYSSPLFLEDFL